MTDLLVTGAGGHLGSVVMATAVAQGRDCLGTVSPSGPVPFVGQTTTLDLRRPDRVEEVILGVRPKVIVHLAGVTTLGAARAQPIVTHEVNVEATALLVELAADIDARLLLASTDMVFDGHEAPYAEDATPNPLSSYGRSKLAAEAHVQGYKRATIARLPLLYGIPNAARPPNVPGSFFRQLVTGLLRGTCPALFCDEFRMPLGYADAALALLNLADHDLGGPVHLPGSDRLSRLEFGVLVAQALGLSTELPSILASEQPFDEPRPVDLALAGTAYSDAFDSAPGRPTSVVLAQLAPMLRGWIEGLD